MAQLESASFRIQDTVNRARYQASGGQPQLNWAQDTVTTTLQIKRPARAAPTQAVIVASARPGAVANPPSPAAAPAQPDVTAITAPSPANLAWLAYGAEVNGTPIMARSFVKPDPDRPYARAALVRIDLSQVQLRLMPGTVEPVAAAALPHFKRPGIHSGRRSESRSAVGCLQWRFQGYSWPLWHDGRRRYPAPAARRFGDDCAASRRRACQIGQWGRDLTANEKSHVVSAELPAFLIYAAGNSLTVRSLAQALQQAGAYYAMQTDINGFYTRFVTYRPADNPKAAGHPLVADKLLNEMSGDPALFLHPYDRDFFYVTLKS